MGERKRSGRKTARETLEQMEIFDFTHLLYCTARGPFQLSLKFLVWLQSIAF